MVSLAVEMVAEGLQGQNVQTFHWIAHLGAPGLFAVSFVSTVVPLAIPGSTDLFLLWLISRGFNPGLMTTCALVGSLLGALTTWRLGKKGGERAIERYVLPRLERAFVDGRSATPC